MKYATEQRNYKLYQSNSCGCWPRFHKTLKTSLHRLTGLRKDVFVFYETALVSQEQDFDFLLYNV